MPKISILKTRPKKMKPLAWLIMKIERVNFSHVAVSYKDQRLNIRYVAEARGSGIRILSNVHFKKDNYIVSGSTYECDQYRIDVTHEYIYNQLAHPYDFKHLIGLGLMRLKQAFYKLIGLKRKASNPFKGANYSQICSELGANVIRFATDIIPPLNLEDYGLKEFNELDLRYGEAMTQEKIDRINGVK